MARRLLRVSVLTMLTFALVLGGGSAATDAVHADPQASGAAPRESSLSQASEQFELRSTIAFASSRDNNPLDMPGSTFREQAVNTAEIYLMDPVPDPTQKNARRLTNNVYYDAFPVLSPDGKKIVFDSNRLGAVDAPKQEDTCKQGTVLCTTTDNVDLFVMNADGSEQRHLTRGASSTIAPNGKYVAYHASASGKKGPFKTSLSAATFDSDIFVLNIDDCREVIERTGVDDCHKTPGEHVKNITNSPGFVDDDPNWSPDGTKIVYTRHPEAENVPDNMFAPHAEIYVMTVGPDGTPVPSTLEKPNPLPLTHTDDLEERAPVWSRDGTRIAFAARRAGEKLEVWVMNADGTNPVRLTKNNLIDGPGGWSPDGTQILVSRGEGTAAFQLYLLTLHPDGTCGNVDLGETCAATQLTFLPGASAFTDWGVLRVVGSGAPAVTQPSTRAPAATPLPRRRGR
jgi:Tol biopolymer transport system component